MAKPDFSQKKKFQKFSFGPKKNLAWGTKGNFLKKIKIYLKNLSGVEI
jgi:hypothetical protein